ncbi:MAG: hypothetical protein JO153_16545 [Solirubrobacterales bacterium]|nr:hypothetical protein [Solirubrobacterales bacterium]
MMLVRRLGLTVAATTALALVGVAVAIADGRAGAVAPDGTFGGGHGWVTTRLRGNSGLGYKVTLVKGGRIVVVGQALGPLVNGQPRNQIVVLRYLSNGRLDRRFGSGGIFKTALPAASGPYNATSVAVDQAGRLIVAGGDGRGDMLALRLSANGRPDRSFGPNRNGVVAVPDGDFALSVAVGPGGRILLGGANGSANGRPMVVARLTSSGRLDRGFGRGGVTQVRFWNVVQAAGSPVNRLVVARDGSVTGSGHVDYIGGDGHGSVGVFRLTSKGRLARSFGQGGHVEVAFRNRNRSFAFWFPCAMDVDARGRVLATGDAVLNGRGALLTARLTPRGTLDRSYGVTRDGRSVVYGLSGDNFPNCGAAVTGAGVLTAGVATSLVQVDPTGRPNRRFARGGVFEIRRPRGVSINALAPAGPGAFLVTGSAGNDVYVARYRAALR